MTILKMSKYIRGIRLRGCFLPDYSLKLLCKVFIDAYSIYLPLLCQTESHLLGSKPEGTQFYLLFCMCVELDLSFSRNNIG
jgi:hypothetical protein